MSGRQLRRYTGTGDVKFTNDQKAAMLLVFGNNQSLCDIMINLITTGAASTSGDGGMATGGGTPAHALVYVINHAFNKHSWIDVKGANKTTPLMNASNILDFSQNVLMLDYEEVRGLKEEGIEYPADFSKFDSTSINATFKSMRNDYMALSRLSQMLIKRACDFVQNMNVMDCKIQNAHLTAATLEHHAVSYDAIKEKSKDASISMIRKN